MIRGKRALLLLAAVAILSVGLLPAAANDTALFIDQSGPAVSQDTAVIQAKYVTINWKALEGSRGKQIRLNLFGNERLTATRDRLDPSTVPGGFVWVGHIEGQPDSTVTLSSAEGVLVGGISWDGYEQAILRFDGSRQVLKKMDPTAVREIEGPDTLPPLANAQLADSPRSTGCEDGSRIDLLVAYTPQASAREGGDAAITALINQRVSDMNSANNNSGLPFRYRLVHTMAVDYVESGDVNIDLARLGKRNDGYLDEVHAARDLYMADLVSLTVAEATTGFTCGVGYLMDGLSTSYESSAYNVAALDYAGEANSCSPWTMAHEFGHNMGSRHERAIDSGPPVLPFAYAYKSPYETFRTIMAYNCENGCPRINHWANPDVSYAGEATGLAHEQDPQNSAENGNAMLETAPFVANFRQSCTVVQPGPYRAFLPLTKTK